MARALHARAFTFGPNIVFAAGEYTPETPRGFHLLTHELVHVAQQSASRRNRPRGIGNTDDPYEAEADRMADQILADVALSRPTPDATGFIRRALQIDTSTVSLTIDNVGAANKVEVISTGPNKGAWCHLTRGANTAAGGFGFSPAIRVTGSVDILLGPGDAQNVSFNFLQFGNLMARSGLWGGRTEAEGSIFINYAVPPAFPTNPSLDSTPATTPFVNLLNSPQTTVSQGPPTRINIQREMGDHPNSKQPLVMPNELTKAPNFLFNMRLDVGFTTVFVARDPAGVFQHLAHFTWHVIYDARFQWQGDNCAGTMVNGRFDVGPVTMGAPTDPTLQTLLRNPRAPFYNKLQESAVNLVGRSGKPPNLIESPKRDPSIPASFYT